ncbi:LysR family transcriptional regulator [Afipia massiliensis]|nr:LysR family transcriptional regulator [Afipia massiliensis]
MFNWADIRFFLEVARQQHLSAAAARLRVDISTVSRRVAELERSLKCKLFERSADGFSLSDEGQRLLAYAEKMEAAATEISSEVAGGSSKESGVVRVATMEALAALVVAPEWSIFRELQPDIALELLVVSQPTNLGRREADISLTMIQLSAARLISQRVGRFKVNLYGSPEYLRRNGTPQSIDELSKHVFIDYLDAFVAVSEVKWLRELAPDARIVVQSTSLIAQQQAAIAGAGLVALPTYAAIPKISLQKILPDHSIWRDLWMTVHADNEYLSRIRATTQFLRSRLPLFLDS